MVSLKDKFKQMFNKDSEKSDYRQGLKPPVVAFDKKGHPVNHYYLDVKGERNYDKNKRLKRVGSYK